MGESYNEIVKRTEDTDFSNNSGGICSRTGMQEKKHRDAPIQRKLIIPSCGYSLAIESAKGGKLMARKFSLAYLTVPGIEAVDQIRMAAEAGYDTVSLRTIPMGQQGEPQNDLIREKDLFAEIRRTLQETGMKVLDIELVRVREDLPLDYREVFEKGAELGATDILSSCWTENQEFAVEAFGKICEQAQEFGMNVNLEYPASSAIHDLAGVARLQEKVQAPNLKLFLDMLYVFWAQDTPEAIQAIAPERFGLIHLCDCPKDHYLRDRTETMRARREYPGLGAIPLVPILKALPKNPCSIELPNEEYIHRYGATGHVERCLAHAKEVLQLVDQ
jgi:sugar phosphate isomerase/epimerase